MKKLFFAFCLMFISASAFAQKGTATWSVQGNYIIDSPSNLGVGGNLGYEFIDNLRGVAEFNYFFKKDYCSFWNVEVNAEYLFKVGDALTIYPLAGLDLLGSKVSYEGYSASDTELGLNIGGGVEYAVSSNLSLKAEYNYKTQGDGYSVLSFGVVIPF